MKWNIDEKGAAFIWLWLIIMYEDYWTWHLQYKRKKKVASYKFDFEKETIRKPLITTALFGTSHFVSPSPSSLPSFLPSFVPSLPCSAVRRGGPRWPCFWRLHWRRARGGLWLLLCVHVRWQTSATSSRTGPCAQRGEKRREEPPQRTHREKEREKERERQDEIKREKMSKRGEERGENAREGRGERAERKKQAWATGISVHSTLV